ncbi:MAG: L-seryl-tRNA(Sec) selenium transferase [Acidobacteriota bacterium]
MGSRRGHSTGPGKTASLRVIPSIEELMNATKVASAVERRGRAAMVRACRLATGALRRAILAGAAAPANPVESLADEAIRRADEAARPSLVRVINATGVLLHTNLGRAPLDAPLIERAAARAGGYSNLEMDLDTGTRGSRLVHLQRHFEAFFPGSSSLVVNNNAAAVLLILNTLAQDREVVVSRGELVEIGGSFRIPDVCERSGAKLVEIGTTNRTRIADYARAINSDTALLMHVHPSNYRVIGFTESVDHVELAQLGRKKKIVVVADLGSGAVGEFPEALAREPSPAQYLRMGFGLVCFSGDKLLGACQAGIIAGRRHLIDRLKRNPLYRALRVDKLTIAILEEALMSAKSGRRDVLLHKMVATPATEIRARADALLARLAGLAEARVEPGESLVGGGSATDLRLPSAVLAVRPRGMPESELLAALRRNRPPVIARVEGRRVLIDLRTVMPEDDQLLAEALENALRGA